MLRNVKAGPEGSGLLVIANQKEHTVLVVDPDDRRELARVVVGVNGHEVMVSKDGRFAFVPIYGNSGVGRPGTDGSTIDVVDLQGRKLAATIDRRDYGIDWNLPLPSGEPALANDVAIEAELYFAQA